MQKKAIEYIQAKVAEAREGKRVVLFTDAMHQIHTSEAGYAWQERGEQHTHILLSNTGRRRLTIMGAYNPLSHRAVIRMHEENCDRTTMKALLDDIRSEYSDHSIPISLFLDNARYQKS